MFRAFYALHRPERGHTHLDRVAGPKIGERLQQVTHRERKLWVRRRSIGLAEKNGANGCNAIQRIDLFAGHT